MSLRLQLAGPRLWLPLVQPLDSVSAAVLAALHNRHVGITPPLAAGLAGLLTRPGSRGSGSQVWGRAWARLVRLLRGESPDRPGRPEAVQHGLVAQAMPSYVVFRLGLPLVEEACHRLGRTCLFSLNSAAADVSRSEYEQYVSDLDAALSGLVADPPPELEMFWAERAATLAGQSRRILRGTADPAGLPESEAAAAALFFRMETELFPSQAARPEAQRLELPPPLRHVRRYKEGGVEGIHKTRREDDFPDILQSEFLNPAPIFFDHVLNVGFLARRRPPRRDQLRDVLVAALWPGCFQGRLAGAFLKACWFDLCARFGRLLCHRRLFDSEFRCVEGNRLQQARTSSYQLRDLTDLDLVDSPAFRHDFRTALGWLPPYLNSRAAFEHLRALLPLPSQAGELDRILAWVEAAWRSQRQADSPQTQTRLWGRAAPSLLELDDFAMVHAMVFLPASLRRSGADSLDPAHALRQLQLTLGLGRVQGRSVSITWIPDPLCPSAAWRLDVPGKLGAKLFPDWPDSSEAESGAAPPGSAAGPDLPPIPSESRFAGALVGAWLEQLSKDLQFH